SGSSRAPRCARPQAPASVPIVNGVRLISYRVVGCPVRVCVGGLVVWSATEIGWSATEAAGCLGCLLVGDLLRFRRQVLDPCALRRVGRLLRIFLGHGCLLGCLRFIAGCRLMTLFPAVDRLSWSESRVAKWRATCRRSHDYACDTPVRPGCQLPYVPSVL